MKPEGTEEVAVAYFNVLFQQTELPWKAAISKRGTLNTNIPAVL
jgi:hypothetical protein